MVAAEVLESGGSPGEVDARVSDDEVVDDGSGDDDNDEEEGDKDVDDCSSADDLIFVVSGGGRVVGIFSSCLLLWRSFLLIRVALVDVFFCLFVAGSTGEFGERVLLVRLLLSSSLIGRMSLS